MSQKQAKLDEDPRVKYYKDYIGRRVRINVRGYRGQHEPLEGELLDVVTPANADAAMVIKDVNGTQWIPFSMIHPGSFRLLPKEEKKK